MKISTKGRYGTRALLDLAMHLDGGPVNVKEIAERQGISPRYLGHLMARLVASGLVRPVRGRSGGFVLSRPPSEITLAEIVETLEERIAVVDCVADAGVCERASFCATRDVWCEVSQSISQHLNGITLDDLCHRQRDKLETQRAMYHI